MKKKMITNFKKDSLPELANYLCANIYTLGVYTNIVYMYLKKMSNFRSFNIKICIGFMKDINV